MSSEETNDPAFAVEPYICTELSAEEIRNEPCWIAQLNDGTAVYSKYDRRSWLELKQHLKENPSLWITGLRLRFRDHTETVHTGADDYFFACAAHGFIDAPTIRFYLAGFRLQDKVLVRRYRVPEIVSADPFESLRSLDDETVKRGLILSNKPRCGFKELTNEQKSLRE